MTLQPGVESTGKPIPSGGMPGGQLPSERGAGSLPVTDESGLRSDLKSILQFSQVGTAGAAAAAGSPADNSRKRTLAKVQFHFVVFVATHFSKNWRASS